MNPGSVDDGRRLADDARVAVRNAAKLGLSLVATWGVAVVVRLSLPRELGPERFGLYSFAESLAANLTAFLGLGIESYTQREIPLRPAHASDYFGGVAALRAALSALLTAGLFGGLVLGGRGFETAQVAAVFGVGFLLQLNNSSMAAFLQANSTVDRLALANVLGKLAWGGLVVTALVLRAPLPLVAGAFVASETLRALALHHEAHLRLGLVLRVDRHATWAVLVGSLPYFANAVALNLNRLDVTVLGLLAGDDRAVGWYSAAGSFSLLVLMLAPLMHSVILPFMARVRARSEEQLFRVVERISEGLIVMATPLALMVALGADLWVRLAFGQAYAPAAFSLRALAPQAVLTYLAAFLSMTLITLDRRWTVTGTSAVAVVLNPLLGALLIPVCARAFGPGGAGAGAALGVVGMELAVILILLRQVGFGVLGRRTWTRAGLCLLVSGAVVGLHLLLAPLGHWRLLVDFGAYLGLGVLTGALPWRDLLALVREVRGSRG